MKTAETQPLAPAPLTAEQEARLKEIVDLFESVTELHREMRRRREIFDEAHPQVKRRRVCGCRRCLQERAAVAAAGEGQEAQDGDDAQG